MRVFVNKPFARFARKEDISDAELCEAVTLAKAMGPDADLGGGLLKLRIAREGKGKSGGYRTLVAYRSGARAVFIHGFAKSDQGNIDAGEKKALKMLAKELLALDDKQMDQAVKAGVFTEVKCDGKKIQK